MALALLNTPNKDVAIVKLKETFVFSIFSIV